LALLSIANWQSAIGNADRLIAERLKRQSSDGKEK